MPEGVLLLKGLEAVNDELVRVRQLIRNKYQGSEGD